MIKYEPKLYRARNQWRRDVADMETKAAGRDVSRRSLKEMLAEAAANTAAIKTDDEPRAA